MAGFLALCAAMVLQPVDELSDDGANQGLSKTGDPQAVPKAKTQPTPKSLKPATSRVNSDASSPKKRPATASGSTPALKRPAASREPGKDEKVTIGKGLYKTGIYGFKINGQEKLRVLQQHSLQKTFSGRRSITSYSSQFSNKFCSDASCQSFFKQWQLS